MDEIAALAYGWFLLAHHKRSNESSIYRRKDAVSQLRKWHFSSPSRYLKFVLHLRIHFLKISNLVFARLPWLDTSCKFVHTPRTSLLPCCMRHHVLSLDHLLHRPRLCILCRNSRLFPDDAYSKGKAEKNWRWRYCLVTWAVWPIRTDTGDQFEAWWCNEMRLSLCICISFLETPKNAVDYEYSTASWLYVPSLIGTLKTLIDISWLSVHESTRMSSSSQSL